MFASYSVPYNQAYTWLNTCELTAQVYMFSLPSNRNNSDQANFRCVLLNGTHLIFEYLQSMNFFRGLFCNFSKCSLPTKIISLLLH